MAWSVASLSTSHSPEIRTVLAKGPWTCRGIAGLRQSNPQWRGRVDYPARWPCGVKKELGVCRQWEMSRSIAQKEDPGVHQPRPAGLEAVDQSRSRLTIQIQRNTRTPFPPLTQVVLWPPLTIFYTNYLISGRTQREKGWSEQRKVFIQ